MCNKKYLLQICETNKIIWIEFNEPRFFFLVQTKEAAKDKIRVAEIEIILPML